MSKLYLPAEWEKQNAIQLTWPHGDTDWKEYLDEANSTYVQMADAITQYERLIVVTPYPDQLKALLAARLPKEQMERVTFNQCPTNDTWARDHGFITLVEKGNDTEGKEEKKENRVVLLDFQFNGWGKKFRADLDNKINRSLYDNGIVKGEYVDLNDFVLEGGSIESDGKGTVFTTSCCLLAPNRNQPLSREDIEQKLKLYLQAERIIWIDYGELTGDDTDGHIDTLVRTAPDDTLIYVGCDDTDDEQYEGLHTRERPSTLCRLQPMASPIPYSGCPCRTPCSTTESVCLPLTPTSSSSTAP